MLNFVGTSNNHTAVDLQTELGEFFHPNDLGARLGMTSEKKQKGVPLVYVTARAVFDRLDDVVGPANWRVRYREAVNDVEKEGIEASLGIRFVDGWVYKNDVGVRSYSEALKGSYSDAVKRAAVQWGIGRYLYNMPNTWVPVDKRGKKFYLPYDFDVAEVVPRVFGGKSNKSPVGWSEEPSGPLTRDQRKVLSTLIRGRDGERLQEVYTHHGLVGDTKADEVNFDELVMDVVKLEKYNA